MASLPRAQRATSCAQRHRGELTASRPRLRFADAAEAWLDGPVADLRPRTVECYRNAVDSHLAPRFGRVRLDAISPDELADLVPDLRADGLSESTGAIVIGVVNPIYCFAARRLGWSGANPVALMLSSE